MIFLAKGTCTLGSRRIDADGNVVEEKPAKFETDPNGGSVAVGHLNDKTMTVDEPAAIFGDYDPWGYLSHALKLLAPSREGNIPDFESIFKKAYREHRNEDCPMLDYCERPVCSNCIAQRWMEEVDEEE